MPVDKIVSDITGNMSNTGGADYIQLTTQLGMVGSVVGVILGFLVAIIIIGGPLVIAIEIMYINFPLMQESLEKLTTRTSGRTQTTLGLVIRDARLAVREANTVQTGHSVNWTYLRIKIKAIFISVLLAGLVMGAGSSVIDLIVSIAKSLITGFKGVF